MKKYFLTMAVLCLTAYAMAVDLPKQGFGLQIGFAQPILRLNSPSNPESAKDSLGNTVHLKGLKVGAVYDVSYVAGFGSTIGINYTFAASHTGWEKKNTSFSERNAYTYHEVELFVDWQYKFEVAKETYLMLYTGPSLQCGIAYSSRYEERNDLTDELTKNCATIHPYTSEEPNEQLRRLNITWGVGLGFQYKRYFLRGGYDFGLINPYNYKQFVDGNGNPIDHYTRGRLDQWQIKIGAYIWYK